MHSLSAVDLNLVVALHALLEERSVTRAAARIGLSQPAVSHALSRLRAQFDDPSMAAGCLREIRVEPQLKQRPVLVQSGDDPRV